MPLDFSDLETFYEELAMALDAVAENDRELLLCKLSLLMARELGDGARAIELISSARNNLDQE